MGLPLYKKRAKEADSLLPTPMRDKQSIAGCAQLSALRREEVKNCRTKERQRGLP